MASFQLLSTSLLCVLVLLGQLPAWMHVATCHDPNCGEHRIAALAVGHQSEEPASDRCCSCCCSHDDVESASNKKAAESDGVDPSEAPVHDSDTCPICQSLAGPCGFVEICEPEVRHEIAIELAELPALPEQRKATHLLPPARGPPAFHA